MPSKAPISASWHSICMRCQRRVQTRRFSSKAPLKAESTDPTELFKKVLGETERRVTRDRSGPSSRLQELGRTAQLTVNSRSAAGASAKTNVDGNVPHHLHVYATKHNTHIAFTRPNGDPILGLACGNIGFRKSHRGTFDSAYQLSTFIMGKMLEGGHLAKVEKIEIVFRGYGPGREAFQKALLGTEGRRIKPLVQRATDYTRLKFGGCKSRNVRRL